MDDFQTVCTYKEIIQNLRPFIADLLVDYLELTLHPDKFYLQEARKGAGFVGSVILQNRTYLRKRTVHGLHASLDAMQDVCREIVETGPDEDLLRQLEHCASSVNSYLGFTIHCNAYNVRRKAFARMGADFYRVCNVARDKLDCVKIRKEYRVKNFLLRKEVKDYDLVFRKPKTKGRRNKPTPGTKAAHR